MNELEFEAMIKNAINSCDWRQDAAGIVLCRAQCLPCKRCIDIGRCDVIKDLMKKLEKENKDGKQM